MLPIRPATPHDSPTVTALVDTAYAKWVAVIGRKPAPMLADYPALAERGKQRRHQDAHSFLFTVQSGSK